MLSEQVISPPDIPNSQTFWHGGNLDTYDSGIAHRKGRSEYGPGLYLTTHYGTAQKYAKGGRKLYMVTVANGTDLDDSAIPMDTVQKFILEYVIGTKRKLVMERLSKFIKDGGVNGSIFNNVMINEDAIKPNNMGHLREFYVQQGIDYVMVDNTFGWHEKMMVLFNMKKIVEMKRVMPNDTIEKFDLHL